MTRFVHCESGEYFNLDFVERFVVMPDKILQGDENTFTIDFFTDGEWLTMHGDPYDSKEKADAMLHFLLTSECPILASYEAKVALYDGFKP